MRHPRATGTYAKLIEEYVVRDRKLTLQDMVRKATGFPAQILGLRDRGVIRPGAKADLLLFDPAHVRARSTFVDPLAPGRGVRSGAGQRPAGLCRGQEGRRIGGLVARGLRRSGGWPPDR